MDLRLNGLSPVDALNRRLFLNRLEGITEAHRACGEGTGSSSVGFIVFQQGDVVAGRPERVAPCDLDRPSPGMLPVQDRSRLSMVAFLLQHESHHIGQCALLRKCFTGRAMSYR